MRDRAVDGGRQALRAAIFFLILFLFVRTFALEPFGVPTGSMAVTLLGNHREIDCPRCGYAVVVGEPSPRERNSLAEGVCPNCGQRHLNFSTARELPGDRLLVDKNVYHVRRPRRWEVAVFHCPVDDSKPYVKRVVGLPGEHISLAGGDAFADGELLRKTLEQSRECRVPVFDHSYPPPGGWGQRWLVETLDGSAMPGIGEILQSNAIHLDASMVPLGLTHRHWNLDAGKEEPLMDVLSYNLASRRRPQTVHDFIATFDLEVVSGSGSFALRLNDGLDSVFVEFGIGGGGTSLGREGEPPAMRTPFVLQSGKTYRIEFAFVDRRASLAVDGHAVPPALDLPAEKLTERTGVSRPVQMGVRNAHVVLREFRISRDVHLRADTPNSSWQLGADEYYVLGDNSHSSHDSREWAIPGVPEGRFLGKPFLIHQPLRLGRVSVGGQDRTYQAIDWSRLRWVR